MIIEYEVNETSMEEELESLTISIYRTIQRFAGDTLLVVLDVRPGVPC